MTRFLCRVNDLGNTGSGGALSDDRNNQYCR
jgi:hypothetical protein